ncbi:N-acetyltransferase [Lacihabitans sp. CCS-44]|uniref:GNAT family N-acetyltransferase n=1 Tax=Lacihabitans sp. CCS-44 TaxID=2487331 RepID=UPI0020CD9733|nr:GNAT family N-acetyltransferase [Lacihabitans sp. CCS-44]MCP9754774.1 N-acetyltransferase [Lacihabitans sp. CCS-44]
MSIEIEDDLIRLRLFSASDIDFLKEVYFSTREKELQQVNDWTNEMKVSFLTHQFEAQHEYYLKNYVGAEFFVIEKASEKIGRLYYNEGFDSTIRIIDIALLPKFQKKGFGTIILKGIFERAKEIQQNVTIHVESFNPAMKLYQKLGFKKISETNGVYHLLEWNYKN